jgi:1-acyl-sn-glycerol-3-phosphate acyltransferase
MQLKRAPHFLAKESLFRLPVFGPLLRRAGQIPVYRSGRSNDEPLRVAVQYLQAGQMVCIFPEGTLTRDPELWPMRGKPGAVRLALETGVPVYPIGQWGSEKVLPQYGAKFRPGFWKNVDILVGDEVNLDAYRNRTLAHNELSEATAVVMSRITELVEQLRGEKAPDGSQWDPEEHGQSVTGNFKKEGK